MSRVSQVILASVKCICLRKKKNLGETQNRGVCCSLFNFFPLSKCGYFCLSTWGPQNWCCQELIFLVSFSVHWHKDYMKMGLQNSPQWGFCWLSLDLWRQAMGTECERGRGERAARTWHSDFSVMWFWSEGWKFVVQLGSAVIVRFFCACEGVHTFQYCSFKPPLCCTCVCVSLCKILCADPHHLHHVGSLWHKLYKLDLKKGDLPIWLGG